MRKTKKIRCGLIITFIIAFLLTSNGFSQGKEVSSLANFEPQKGDKVLNEWKKCPFCDPKILEKQKIYEDENVYALYTIKPITEGHILILPKRHVSTFDALSDNELLAIKNMVKKVKIRATDVLGTSGYILLEKNGKEAGQSIPHVHFHFIPRKPNTTPGLLFTSSFFLRQFLPPICDTKLEEMKRKFTKKNPNETYMRTESY